MEDRLAGVGEAVHHQPEAAALAAGVLETAWRASAVAVVIIRPSSRASSLPVVEEVGHMALRHDQQVHGSLGRDVREGDELVVLEEQAGRNLAGDDATEEASVSMAFSPSEVASGVGGDGRAPPTAVAPPAPATRTTLAPRALSFVSIAS